MYNVRLVRLLSTALLVTVCSMANSQMLFNDSFEAVGPTNEREAARFLLQTTFGIRPAEIARVSRIGYRPWIDEQIALSPSLLAPKAEALLENRDFNPRTSLAPDGTQYGRKYREDFWFTQVITGDDQLRQRIAFALSQIFVISNQEALLAVNPMMETDYYDMLTKNAFGNYRDLLENVSLHPAMGYYLSHRGNRRREELAPGLFASPDENYAREVMQLFSIGIFARNQDYSLVDADADQPGVQTLESYDENIVANLARVFTGFSFRCTPGEVTVAGETLNRACTARGADCQGADCHFLVEKFLTFRVPPKVVREEIFGAQASILFEHPDAYRPMICYPSFHDGGREPGSNLPYPERPSDGNYPDEPYRDKRIVGFWPGIGDGPLPMQDIDEDCANLGNNNFVRFNNPLPGDAQKRQQCVDYCNDELRMALDALFNHPNTAPVFSHRMIQFLVTSNPSPSYVERVANVFDDNGQGVRGDLEAVFKAILLDQEARNQSTDLQFGKLREPMIKLASLYRSAGFVSPDGHWGGRNPDTQLEQHGQVHLYSPSVFNFYSRDYQQPGPIADSGLFSPEFEVFSQTTAIKSLNNIKSRICHGYGTPNTEGRVDANCGDVPPSRPFTFQAPERGPYVDPAFLDSFSDDGEAVIEQLNTLLLAGAMSGSFSDESGLKGALRHYWESNTSLPGRRRILLLIHLITISPEFSVQR